MLEYDLINKLSAFLIQKKYNEKAKFFLITIMLLFFGSFFYFLTTELRNLILYFSYSSFFFFVTIIYFMAAWHAGLGDWLKDLVSYVYKNKNTTYHNEYILYYFASTISLLLAFIAISIIFYKFKIPIQVDYSFKIFLCFYTLTTFALIIAMARLTFKKSIFFFLNPEYLGTQSVIELLGKDEKRNKELQTIYNKHKSVLEYSYRIKTAIWISILFISIIISLTYMSSMEVEILKFSKYPTYPIPEFDLNFKSIIKFTFGYIVVLGGWSLGLVSAYIAFKTFMKE